MYQPHRNIDSNLIREVIESGFSLKLDPNTIIFKSIHKEQGKSFHKELLQNKMREVKLRRPILRNSFLYGCLRYCQNEQIEHLIAGYGNRYGGGVNIDYYYHIEGNEDSVSISNEELIIGHLATLLPNTQLIIFHNHPENEMSEYLRGPLPSIADRDTLLLQKYLFPIQIIRYFWCGKEGMKFYLGENGKVMEYRTPAFSGIMKLLGSLNKGG